jgi:hypothetical protein
MNSKDFIQALRKVIREEVSNAVRTELSKITPIINEQVTTAKYTQTAKPTVTNKVIAKAPVKKQYTDNPTLNELLNDTAGFRNEYAGVSLDESINYNDFEEWPTMGRKPASPASPIARTIVPSVDLEGRPVNVAKLAETEAGAAVVNALTRDYSALVKAMDKKKGK